MTAVITRQRAQEVHDLARARAGLPYSYGGAFTRDPKVSTDCSGLVLQTAAWYQGRQDWPGNRYGSTESFRLNYKIVSDLGFKRLPAGGLSALGFTPVMLVGLQHGGGGIYSHTACTLMTMDVPGGPVVVSKRGVDWESRGGNPGVYLYDGARAWNDPLFHDFWYLDARLEAASVTIPPPKAPALSAADRYATAIIAEGKRRRITERGIVIALSTALVESNLRMYANAKVPESLNLPHDAVGSDAYSVGLFQQQVVRGQSGWWWGDAATCMDPAKSAGLFYDRLVRFDYNSRERSPGWFAAEIQQPAQQYRGRYDERMTEAQRIYDRLANQIPTRDPLEELLMSGIRVPSMSIYAEPGEPDVLLSDMIRAFDAHGSHEDHIEKRAKLGDPDALFKVARTAAGRGVVKEQWAITQACDVLAEIKGVTPEDIRNQLRGTAA